jgi:hypothetical protein
MKPFKKFGYYMSLLLIMQTAYGCSGKPKNGNSSIAVGKKDLIASSTVAVKDEEQFRSFLKKFKSVIKGKNKAAIAALFHFPLQTLPQWTNDELKNTTITPQEGLINQTEFLNYFDDIFTRDAVRLIPVSKEDDLSEINKTTPENYYKTLQQLTDRGSTLYELQKQYTEDNGTETLFGFVFGRVKGNYKVISYYRPWPLK